MKVQILKLLRSQDTIISGEELSTALGISRVSVWKHIHKLQELGYHIMSTPNGYRLIDSPDIPFPWEFTDRGFNVLYYPEVTSTIDTAKDLARKNCPDFTVVVAGRQSRYYSLRMAHIKKCLRRLFPPGLIKS
jgi:BirA family biotin operon repressor/biotin-[acetyl-CoA-carboxylase] ligase